VRWVTGTPARDASDAEVGTSDGGDSASPAPGFDVLFPPTDVVAGQSLTTCYYLHTSNVVDANVKSWASRQSGIVAHMALVFTPADVQPAGTVSTTSNCSIFGGAGASWVYSSWTPVGGWTFPSDDGSGAPVGKPVKQGQSAYLVVEALNATANTQKATAELHATAYAAGVSVTAAEPYVATNVNLNIPAATASDVESKTCAVPAGVKFNWMSVYTHVHAVRRAIKDSATVLFQTTNLADPGATTKGSPPFATFTSNQVTYECEFANASAVNITFGPDRNTEEACAMLSYHFPATKPRSCINSSLAP